MNREDLLEAIGDTDEVMLEASEKHTKRNWLLSIAAACICLLIGVSVFLRLPTGTHRIILEDISWRVNYDLGDVEDCGTPSGTLDGQYNGIEYQFIRTMSVEARVIDVLPDIYVAPSGFGEQAYYVLHLRILDTIVGEGFPKKIYYLLPAYLDPDLTEYDSFIINLAQFGAEDFLLINTDKQQVESFDFVFRKADYTPHFGAFMAFTNGQLDTGLWDKRGWSAAKSTMLWLIADIEEYPGKIGRSLSQTKKIIQESSKDMSGFTMQEVINQKVLQDYKGGKEALQEVQLTETSLFTNFVSRYVFEGVHYVRYIHGFITNDMVSFDVEAGKAYRTPGCVAFTKEDMQNLPNLPWAVEHLHEILAENLPNVDTQQVKTTFVQYYKCSDAIYGEITITLPGEQEDRYVIVFQDGTVAVMTKQEYAALIDP